MNYTIKSLMFFLAACAMSGCVTGTVLPSDEVTVIEAVKSDDLGTLKRIFDHLPPGNDQRTKTEKNLLNQALQLTASKGEACNMEIANYLYGKGALADYYTMPEKDSGAYNSTFEKWKIPLCGTFLVDSHRKFMADRVTIMQSQDKRNTEVKGYYIKLSYNNLVAFLNNVDYKNPTALAHGIRAFTPVAQMGIVYGKEACAKDSASKSCESYGLYKKLQGDLLSKKDFAKKSDAYRQLKDFDDTLKKMML